MLFGIVPTCINDELREMIPKMRAALYGNIDARVKFPCQQECAYLASLVHRREPSTDDVIGFLDGFKAPVQCSSSPEDQATDYCGYTCDTFCNNVLLFGSDGKVKWSAINAPGLAYYCYYIYFY